MNIPKEVLNEPSVTKQRQVLVNLQIENWDDVVAWGYSGETDAWEDLFKTMVSSLEMELYAGTTLDNICMMFHPSYL